MTDPTSDDVRDDFILQERLAGRSARAISKQLRCTVGEVDAALDRVLPKLDNAARQRHVLFSTPTICTAIRRSPSAIRKLETARNSPNWTPN